MACVCGAGHAARRTTAGLWGAIFGAGWGLLGCCSGAFLGRFEGARALDPAAALWSCVPSQGHIQLHFLTPGSLDERTTVADLRCTGLCLHWTRLGPFQHANNTSTTTTAASPAPRTTAPTTTPDPAIAASPRQTTALNQPPPNTVRERASPQRCHGSPPSASRCPNVHETRNRPHPATGFA